MNLTNIISNFQAVILFAALITYFILLIFVYVLGVGTTSLFAKILKKFFLDIKINEETKTYWINSAPAKKSIDEYYRQF